MAEPTVYNPLLALEPELVLPSIAVRVLRQETPVRTTQPEEEGGIQ